jgi:hypothetical protein
MIGMDVRKHERWLMPAMLVGGTAIDAVQFQYLKPETTFAISAAYALICALALVAMRMKRFPRAASLAVQFTFGALLSTSLLFYWFSGALSVSWPVIGTAALLMVSNEVCRAFFTKPRVQVAIFSFVLFSIATAFAAYYFNSISSEVFLIGGSASAAVALFFVAILRRATGIKERLWPMVAGVFLVMNALYIANLIPPIPLSLREAGMYYKITGDYQLEGPTESGLDKFLPSQDIPYVPGQPLYAYSAIYAPVDLTTTIVHEWEWYNETTKRWETKDRLSFALRGGRQEGYRGYSVKRSLSPGKWRVSVETESGQVLGRIGFDLEGIP